MQNNHLNHKIPLKTQTYSSYGSHASKTFLLRAKNNLKSSTSIQ